jgi:hypothetical protein
MPTAEFLRAWCAIAYLYPGLHPDGHDEPDSGWPARLLPMAVEAWNRFEAAQLSEEELYPSDAQWCGLYDSMATHTEEEVERRAVFARKETV